MFTLDWIFILFCVYSDCFVQESTSSAFFHSMLPSIPFTLHHLPSPFYPSPPLLFKQPPFHPFQHSTPEHKGLQQPYNQSATAPLPPRNSNVPRGALLLSSSSTPSSASSSSSPNHRCMCGWHAWVPHSVQRQICLFLWPPRQCGQGRPSFGGACAHCSGMWWLQVLFWRMTGR